MPLFDRKLSDHPLCNPACQACHYKDLPYWAQLEKKQAWAEQQFGRWKNRLNPILPAPAEEQLGYRSKTWLRTSFQNGEVDFGMFRAVRKEGAWTKEFLSWRTCPLHLSSLSILVERLREKMKEASVEFCERSWVGVWLGSPHCVLVSRDPIPQVVQELPWGEILVPPFDRVWFHQNNQVGKKIFGHRPIEWVFGVRDLDEENTVHPIRAFRQIAQTLLVEARTKAVEGLLKHESQEPPQCVLDLYCGTGALSTLLPPRVGWLGIEISKEAVTYAKTLRPFHSNRIHEAFAGAVEHRLKDPKVVALLQKPYALYLNPPRSGLTPEAREQVSLLIQEKKPTSVVYLSCSASRLSRDLPLFESHGYRVEFLQPYDFFPQTEHFETLAILNQE